MWNLPHTIQIQKARMALKNGHLNAAFDIVTKDNMKDYQQCLKILENLVSSFVKRAQEHLSSRRFEDALSDVEKAQKAGGNRPAIAEIREEILSKMHKKQQNRHQLKKALESVQSHIKSGRLEDGAKLLLSEPIISSNDVQAGELQQRIDLLKCRAGELRARIGKSLKNGELEEALASAQSLKEIAANQPDTHAILEQVIYEAGLEISNALNNGNPVRAKVLLNGATPLKIKKVQMQEWTDAVNLIDKASLAIDRGDWTESRSYLGRLKRILPDALWIMEYETQLKTVEETLHELAAGPLGETVSALRKHFPSSHKNKNPKLPIKTAAVELNRNNGQTHPSAGNLSMKKQYVLWVNSIGSYLLHQSEQVTLGRAGSSAKPDIALPADLEGIHARILRVDHDYFLVPRGPASVNGKTSTRHLLSDGDKITLGSRWHLTFRLPTALSSTAILELDSSLRISGDIRKVLLLDGHLIFGPPGTAHIGVPELKDRIVLSVNKSGFRCRAPAPITINGRPGTRDESIPPGSNIEAHPVTFTLTELTREGERK